ncbi:hypothetical protein HDV06_007162 [Boothiomyces sp. JEL0866]|nr:hypothetical protein HDV06_007162 [Boothiomyces sp. JEL0866]
MNTEGKARKKQSKSTAKQKQGINQSKQSQESKYIPNEQTETSNELNTSSKEVEQCWHCTDNSRHLARHMLSCKKIDVDLQVQKCQFCSYGHSCAVEQFKYLDHLHKCVPFQLKLHGFLGSAEKSVEKIKQSPVINLSRDFAHTKSPASFFNVEFINGEKYYVYKVPAGVEATPVSVVNDFSPACSPQNITSGKKDVTLGNQAAQIEFLKGTRANINSQEELLAMNQGDFNQFQFSSHAQQPGYQFY